MWRLYQTAFGPHHSQMTTSAHAASSLERRSSCSPSEAHWSTRISRPGWSLKYAISGVKNFRSWPAMTTRSGGLAGASPAAAAPAPGPTARARYPRSRSAALSSVNSLAAADVLAAARANTAGAATHAAAASATSSRLAANSG